VKRQSDVTNKHSDVVRAFRCCEGIQVLWGHSDVVRAFRCCEGHAYFACNGHDNDYVYTGTASSIVHQSEDAIYQTYINGVCLCYSNYLSTNSLIVLVIHLYVGFVSLLFNFYIAHLLYILQYSFKWASVYI
jgi:hypothetical protein